MIKTTRSDLTKWSATFYVAAELSRRGFAVGLTHGNTQKVDILAVDETTGRTLAVDVKGVVGKNSWMLGGSIVEEVKDEQNWFVVLVSLPKDERERPEFYVLPRERARNLVEKSRKVLKERGRKDWFGLPYPYTSEGHHLYAESDPRLFKDGWPLMNPPRQTKEPLSSLRGAKQV